MEDIYVDDRVKMRANVSPKVVAEYAEAMASVVFSVQCSVFRKRAIYKCIGFFLSEN